MQRLAVFDLDHTLLDGDSDVLWCEFLMDEGLLERASFEPSNAAMARDYRSGAVGVLDFCNFYIGTLAGRSAADWAPLRERFVRDRVLPRMRPGTAALLGAHRERGDLLVLSTATNRFITEPTAEALGFEHLLATECALDAAGRFVGRTEGEPNMRTGKIIRLQAWLARRGLELSRLDSVFYSDSMNDVPLLEQVREPVVTHGEPRLLALAAERGWRTLRLDGSADPLPQPPEAR